MTAEEPETVHVSKLHMFTAQIKLLACSRPQINSDGSPFLCRKVKSKKTVSIQPTVSHLKDPRKPHQSSAVLFAIAFVLASWFGL